jgi:membrane-bound lytic murein transglycosylase C
LSLAEVHREDKIIKPDFLYTPENNIHLGYAYLAKMRDNEFKNVNDPEKLRYCLIAAYNTGPSNVCHAVAGE